MRKFKKLLIVFVLSIGFGMSLIGGASAVPTPTGTPAGGATTGGNAGGEEACKALEEVGVTCTPTTTPEDLAGKTIKNLINLFSIIVGGVCVMMVIFGGFKFVTSGGDADGTKSARNTILYAVAGLAVVLLAQTIVYFVFSKASELQTAPTTAPTTSPAAPGTTI